MSGLSRELGRRRSGPREQETVVVVDLGHRADRRARVAGGRAGADGDGRRQAPDGRDIRAPALVDETPDEGGEALDIALERFRVKGIESERRLAAPGRAADDRELVEGNDRVDALEIVGRRPRSSGWARRAAAERAVPATAGGTAARPRRRALPVREAGSAATSSGVPATTTRPPSSPLPGPRSMTRSAARMNAGSCSTATMVLPFVHELAGARRGDFRRRGDGDPWSARPGCRACFPICGRPSSEASRMRWASPPERVVELCPSFR